VAPDGTRRVVIDGLDFTSGIAAGSRNTLYGTNHGTSAGAGEVLRIEVDR
jgi:hypothetical protein